MPADCAAEKSRAKTQLDNMLLHLMIFCLRDLIEREMVGRPPVFVLRASVGSAGRRHSSVRSAAVRDCAADVATVSGGLITDPRNRPAEKLFRVESRVETAVVC